MPQAIAPANHNPVDTQPTAAAPLAVALNLAVRDSLRIISSGGAILFFLFAISHLFLLPRTIAPFMSSVAASTAVTFLVLRLWLMRNTLPLHAVHPVIAGLGGLVLLNSLLHLLLMNEIKHTSNVALLVIGIGGLTLMRWWFYALITVVCGSWAAILVFMSQSPDLTHYLVMMVCAVMLSVVLHNARLRSMVQLYALHIQDEQQQVALEQAITALRQNDLVLQQAKETAERANAAKSEFIAMVSHELKTPLSVVLGYADLMRLSHSSSEIERAQSFEMIRHNAKLMQALIEELNELSEIEVQNLTLRPQPVRLLTSVLSVTNAFQHTMQGQAQQLELLVAEDMLVQADPLRLVQILNNLVSNAVKYSPEGGRIAISAVHSRDESMVAIAVSDTGIGISAADQAHIFERFFRTSTGKERHIEGTGLGLYITRRLVELHGGRIWLESTLSRGTCFHIELPSAQPALLDPPNEPAALSLVAND